MNFQKKAIQLFTLVASTVIVMSSCSSKNDDDTVVTPPVSVDTVVTGTLSANKTLTSDRTWILKGYVYVPNGITLTIQAGTTIKSDISQKGALIVERGGKLEAAGTADRPIVFTSGKAAGSREPGDWGGIILLGNARTNRSTPPVIEGGVDRVYGGTNDADNSGTLRYVRIEYAGLQLSLVQKSMVLHWVVLVAVQQLNMCRSLMVMMMRLNSLVVLSMRNIWLLLIQRMMISISTLVTEVICNMVLL